MSFIEWQSFMVKFNIFKFLYRILLKPIVKICYERLIKPIIEIKDSPHSIALGTAIGMWVALTPTVGIQMTVCLIVCTLLKANILIAVAMCWISNPITFIPMYYGYYRFGLFISNTEPSSWQEFQRMLNDNFVIVSTVDPETFKESQELHALIKIAQNKDRIHYTSQNEEITEKLNALLKEANLSNDLLVDDSQVKKIALTNKDLLNQQKVPESLEFNDKTPIKVKIKKPKAWWHFWKIQQLRNTETWWQVYNKKNTYNIFEENEELSVHYPTTCMDVIKQIEENGGYAFVDDTTLLKRENQIAQNSSKAEKLEIVPNSSKLNTIAVFPREQTFLGICLILLSLGLTTFALPMWIGSLIIATVISIPTYFIVYHLMKSSLKHVKPDEKDNKTEVAITN